MSKRRKNRRKKKSGNNQWGILLLCLTIVSLTFWWSQPKVELLEEHSFKSYEIPENELNEKRQLVTIKVDSLLPILEHIHNKHPDLFEYKSTSGSLKLETKPQNAAIKLFNAAFFDDKDITDLEKINNLSIEILNGKTYGFRTKVKTFSKEKFVILPSEILQSIILKYKGLK